MTKVVTYLLVVPESVSKEYIEEVLKVLNVPVGVIDYDFEGTFDLIKRVYDSGQELAKVITERVDASEDVKVLVDKMYPMLIELQKRLEDEGLLE